MTTPLAGLDQRATTLTAQIAALARDAGAPGPAVDDRADLLRTEITTAGITAAALLLDLVLTLHHTVRGDDTVVRDDIARLGELTRNGDYAYYTDIAHFITGLPLTSALAGWTAGQPATVAAPGHRPPRTSVNHPVALEATVVRSLDDDYRQEANVRPVDGHLVGAENE
ncbi:hypothetical protein [Streptomyces sp. NPDC058240]|uniref:hypothetical protein n=1 Tax=Streptomyces sp. NPDC058240 TaxID=3346396 RepID=UPI0036EFB6E1